LKAVETVAAEEVESPASEEQTPEAEPASPESETGEAS